MKIWAQTEGSIAIVDWWLTAILTIGLKPFFVIPFEKHGCNEID